jgi:DNA polymerase zeta
MKTPSRRGKVSVFLVADETGMGLMSVAHVHALATSQIARPTQKNRYGFKFSQKQTTKESEREHQSMSVLALEVFGESSSSVIV